MAAEDKLAAQEAKEKRGFTGGRAKRNGVVEVNEKFKCKGKNSAAELTWKAPARWHPRGHNEQTPKSVFGLQTGEESNRATLAEATKDDAIVRNSSCDFASNNVID